MKEAQVRDKMVLLCKSICNYVKATFEEDVLGAGWTVYSAEDVVRVLKKRTPSIKAYPALCGYCINLYKGDEIKEFFMTPCSNSSRSLLYVECDSEKQFFEIGEKSLEEELFGVFQKIVKKYAASEPVLAE